MPYVLYCQAVMCLLWRMMGHQCCLRQQEGAIPTAFPSCWNTEEVEMYPTEQAISQYTELPTRDTICEYYVVR